MTDPATLAHSVAGLMPGVRADLERLVRIPGCAFDGFPREDIDRAATEVERILRDAGYPTVTRIEPGGSPAVYAEAPGPAGSPTVLLYAHYDVQPAGDLAAWHSDPWEPTERDGRLYGRGAADDKSGVVIHAALMRAFGGRPPCTVKVIVEGEEEWGGPFEEYPRANPALFDADAIVVADVGNLRIGEPTFTTALRGMAEAYLEIRTLEGPVHSGMFGGPAPDALMALITALASLRDENGDCAVEGVGGFDWQGADYPEDVFRSVAGVVDGQPLTGTRSIASRLCSRPVANVVGIDAPAVDGAINAVIPWARAKVSLRLPPGVDPEAAQERLIAHLRAHVPWGVAAEVTPGRPGNGIAVDTTGPAYAAARRAMRAAYGRDAVEIGAGGSIPLLDELRAAVPRAELLLFGAQDPLARIHAPNESVDLAELERSVLAETLFVAELAAGTG